MKIVRTNSKNEDFINLVKKLDAYLQITDGEEHEFYNQFNHIDVLKYVVVAYQYEKPVGCGAIKKFDANSIEIKRMYVAIDNRGKGFAQIIINELEVWAQELGYKKTVLETGKRQVAALKFYHKCGYNKTENYGQYKGMENSVCFEKLLF